MDNYERLADLLCEYSVLADHYEQEALRTFERQRDIWADDEGMLDMIRGDYNDHLTVAGYVRAGQLDRARHKLWMMDTVAREECPDKVYAVLYPYY